MNATGVFPTEYKKYGTSWEQNIVQFTPSLRFEDETWQLYPSSAAFWFSHNILPTHVDKLVNQHTLVDDSILSPSVSLSESLPAAIRDNWNGLFVSKLSEAAYERLRIIASQEEGWRGAHSLSLRSSSLRNFLQFWENVQFTAAEPEFALAPNGYIQAEWHRNWKKHLEIEFCENEMCYYGLCDGNSIHEGRATVSELVSLILLRRSKPLLWC